MKTLVQATSFRRVQTPVVHATHLVRKPRQPLRLALASLRFSAYGRRVLRIEQANRVIAAKLQQSRPLMVARLGNSELDTMSFWLFHRGTSAAPSYPRMVVKRVSAIAGFFPPSAEALDQFSRLNAESVRQTDVMGVWFNRHEDFFCRNYCSQAELVELRGLEPYYSRQPRSRTLAGRKVLIVHPFARTIESQYNRVRQHLFQTPDVLPDFELKTVKAVLSLANHPTGFSDWFAALRHMQEEIAKVDFEVALIGAGAYGLPLAAYIKGLGKQAIHLGGATQLMFGIKGKRWDTRKEVARLYNEHWVRPLPEETPANTAVVEGGCYW